MVKPEDSTGIHTFAIALSSTGLRQNYALCAVTLKSEAEGQEVIGATLMPTLEGTAFAYGSVKFPDNIDGWPITLTVDCAKLPDRERAVGLRVEKDGTFSAGENGVTARLLVRAPSDEGLHPPKPGEILVKTR